MQQYRFWAIIRVGGIKQRKEFVYTATNWAAARRMLSEELKNTPR